MDLTIEYTNIRSEFSPQRDGRTIVELKVVTFYLGKFGPFTERFPAEATAADMTARIRALQGTLLGLPT